MTYREHEVLGGRPVELYHFSQGATNWYYTSGDESVVKNANTYVPLAISRSEIEVNEEARTNDIAISLPTNHALVTIFKSYAPSPQIAVIVYRRQLDDVTSQWITVFSGEIRNCEMGVSSATLNCIPTQTSIERRLLNIVAQPLCNNRLYDERCQVSRVAWTYNYVVADFTSIVFVPFGLIPYSAQVGAFVKLGGTAAVDFADDLTGLNATNPAYTLMGGVAKFGDQRQAISLHVIDGIWLLDEFSGLEIGDTLTLYAGCDKAVATCRDKFSNLPRFLGFPYMPTKNPFGDEGIA